MANSRSAEKAARVTKRRTEINRRVRTALRTYVKSARTDLQSGDVEQARKTTSLAISKLDQAGARGYIHRNTASRSTSRLERRLAALTASVLTEKPKRKTKAATRKKTSATKATKSKARSTKKETQKSE